MVQRPSPDLGSASATFSRIAGEAPEKRLSMYRIGVDVGGTFTDLVCYDPKDSSLKIVKISSSPPDFHRAVIEAVGKASEGGILRGAVVVLPAAKL